MGHSDVCLARADRLFHVLKKSRNVWLSARYRAPRSRQTARGHREKTAPCKNPREATTPRRQPARPDPQRREPEPPRSATVKAPARAEGPLTVARIRSEERPESKGVRRPSRTSLGGPAGLATLEQAF